MEVIERHITVVIYSQCLHDTVMPTLKKDMENTKLQVYKSQEVYCFENL